MPQNALRAILLTCLFIALTSIDINAQEINYRRSSLHLILIESDNFPNKESVMSSYNSYPFPDRYNEHNIGIKSFNPANYKITDAEREANGSAKSKLGKLTSKAVSESSNGMIDSVARDLPLQIEKFIKDNQIAKKVAAKWFNRKDDGTIDYELIKQRGAYSASAEDKDMANATASASDYLLDFELIGNSFVVFNKQTFVSNEIAARIIRDIALSKADSIPNEQLKQKAIEGANKIYERTKEGYTVITKSWLYQLNWNEEVATTFKSYFLNEKIDSKAAWDTTTLFKLNFIGDEVSSALVTFSLKTKRTENEIIDLAVKRNIDNVFSKLQKKYEVFRPVSPVTTVGPVTARIGKKEGLEPGQTFDVLESRKDPKTGAYKYESIGTVKVSKKAPIWDNRIGSKEEPELDESGNPIVTPEFTTFDGGKKVQPGMHFLRLKK